MSEDLNTTTSTSAELEYKMNVILRKSQDTVMRYGGESGIKAYEQTNSIDGIY